MVELKSHQSFTPNFHEALRSATPAGCSLNTTSYKTYISVITLFVGMIMSQFLSLHSTTGTLFDGVSGRFIKQLVTNMPPGKGDDGGSTTIQQSGTWWLT